MIEDSLGGEAGAEWAGGGGGGGGATYIYKVTERTAVFSFCGCANYQSEMHQNRQQVSETIHVGAREAAVA